jgi:hypothetical protein
LSRIVRLLKAQPKYELLIDSVGHLQSEESGLMVVNFICPRVQVGVPKEYLLVIEPTDFGDSKDEKICNVCARILPTSSFEKNQNGKDNRSVRRPSCKDCREGINGVAMNSAEERKWKKSKPHHVPFTCPICAKTAIAGLNVKIVLNHDHQTGKITGWICDSCNTGLGRFKDDIEILHRAISYLEQHLKES